MVSDVNFTTALNQQQNTASASSALADDFAQFLNLLTVQLQNQDPLEPMETNEFTNQLVAFTGVEQQINTNQKLDSLVSLQLNTALTSALSYVGLDVSYLGTDLYYDGTTPGVINYALSGDALKADINILDADGNVVFTAEAAKSAGANEFVWDGSLSGGGLASPGTYSVRVDALDADDRPVQSSIVVQGRVFGVETQNGQIFALVGERAVPVSSILNAKEPEEIGTSQNSGGSDEENDTEGE